ncbi:MAG: sigma-54-dependent Fis family transcriptional regulator [candidate division Zixibacteria bacterium]|nr:sigma-54-dependent Fis family transcriptional regulator [candidate division Zixibacteria bacterium]
MSRILVIDDEPKMTMLISASLEDAGHSVTTAGTGKEAMTLLKKNSYDLVVSDIRLPAPDGMEILSWLSKNVPETMVIMMTAFAEVKNAVEAMKMGASDYLIKPFPLEELTLLTSRLLNHQKTTNIKKMREADYDALAYDDFIGTAPATKKMLELIGKVAVTDTTVLINGESGSGKELAAKMIHNLSPRKDKPFIAVNCAALTETLLESELFGHEKGAFTGAIARKPGRFELAEGGTIFLDEIGEMSPSLQAKLLRVLEERNLVRVGGVDVIKVDIRLVTATNRILKQMIKDGEFREDLFFRINVFPVTMPPLRERIEDIPLLAEYFLKKQNFHHPDLEDEVKSLLNSYHWPGNIRELKNILDRAVILAGDNAIDPGCIGIDDEDIAGSSTVSVSGSLSLGDSEKEMILQAIEKAGGNKTEAAKTLGITRRKLYSRMKIHGIAS